MIFFFFLIMQAMFLHEIAQVITSSPVVQPSVQLFQSNTALYPRSPLGNNNPVEYQKQRRI